MTQKWFTTLSLAAGKLDVFSKTDLEILKQLPATPKEDQVITINELHCLLCCSHIGNDTWALQDFRMNLYIHISTVRNWWNTLPSFFLSFLSSAIFQERVTQQGVHECLHRDIMVGFGDWEFDPTELSNPFPNNDGAVHLWQGYEDKYIPYKLNRYLSQQLPWLKYHEVPDGGHLFIYNATLCEAVFRALVSA